MFLFPQFKVLTLNMNSYHYYNKRAGVFYVFVSSSVFTAVSQTSTAVKKKHTHTQTSWKSG